jgi:uncharacterized protein (DUF2062 family)
MSSLWVFSASHGSWYRFCGRRRSTFEVVRRAFLGYLSFVNRDRTVVSHGVAVGMTASYAPVNLMEAAAAAGDLAKVHVVH